MFIREVKEASTHQKELVRRLIGGASTSAFYGTPPAVHSRTTWFPGEVIECGNTGTSRRNEMEELKGWMHQLVADMQTSILGRISDIEQNIQSLSDRVSSLERQNEAVDVLQQADETATAAMPHQSPRHTRTRKAPTEIQASGVRISLQCLFLPYQGRIREVYNNLGEELHFRLDEGIDSQFNKKIVSLVAAEFDKDHCPIATVKAGLVTYKRTLKRALTSNDSTSRRVKRSRQQRLWEKRCQVLKDDEKQLWGDIKPTMMSEEESDDQNAQTLQRRRPSWRSDRLNDLIDDLDERINGTSNSKLHPKKQRIEGPLLDASTPPTAQPWMIREKA
ncbi:hypothetical protein EMCRGX_G032592 [Ephydatia muelleri]